MGLVLIIIMFVFVLYKIFEAYGRYVNEKTVKQKEEEKRMYEMVRAVKKENGIIEHRLTDEDIPFN